MTHKLYRTGAIGALLDEYEKAINETIDLVEDLSDNALTTIVDHKTSDPNCRSVQTVLAHVIASMYSYAIYIRTAYGQPVPRPGNILRPSVGQYMEDFNAAMQFTADSFSNINDEELDQPDPAKQMDTTWGKHYDLEQLTEHAIVHVLRHRRQLEKFRILLRQVP
ncbi:DinB family protein [Chitinophaga pendula]|uniref:DinB family protein n=1 Tax=Chitinophaga TaxID=79328 RepID=UPI000BB0A09B|nr:MULTISPECIES: DinB family protein [Chitinophaga]ASZ11852.1 damage-inducible protein DinB [Chitinophaga sp. MD30]UCJ05123.1 DinB family protein [Chitinophaga pendula]